MEAETPKDYTETIRTRSEIDPQTRQWQLSGFDIIEEVRHRLRGEIPTTNPQSEFVEWINVTDPIANEKGIAEITRIMSAYINKNIQLSEFDERETAQLLKGFESALVRKIETDFIEMDIRKEDADQVFLIVANTVWAGINRARFGGEKKFIEGTEQRRIVSSESPEKGKGESFFDKIPVIGKD